jgi:hypothetical protein
MIDVEPFCPAPSKRIGIWKLRAILPISFMMVLLPVCVVAIATAPGLYTIDSIVQLGQARTGQYSDWHPPMMAGVWSFLIFLTGSFSSLFWAQLCLYSAGLMLWAYAFWNTRLWGALIGLVVLSWSPFLLNFAGVVWKDVEMAFSLLVAFGIVAIAHIRGRSWAIISIFALPFIVYATGARHNALPAALPLFFMMIWFSCEIPRSWRICMSVVGTIAAAAAVFGTVYWISYDYLGAKKQYPGQYIALYDLAGLSVRTNTDLIPTEAKAKDFSMERLVAAYKPFAGDFLFYEPPVLQTSRDPNTIAAVRRVWLSEILEHPVVYLTHRWDLFRSLLRIGESGPFFAFVDAADSDKALRSIGEIGEKLPWSSVASALLGSMFTFANEHTPFFMGWFWAISLLAVTLVAGFLTACSRQKPLARMSLCLSCSGILYMLPYFFVVPTSDFRYLYWCVVSTSVAGVIVFGIAAERMVFYWSRRKPVFVGQNKPIG